MSGAGFDKYCEIYDAYPNVLLCVRYICDVGHIIVSGTDAASELPSTHDASHHTF